METWGELAVLNPRSRFQGQRHRRGLTMDTMDNQVLDHNGQIIVTHQWSNVTMDQYGTQGI